MSQSKDHVLVVHGTFNAPEPGVKKWYQLNPADPENFCIQLNAALERCGADLKIERDAAAVFAWSGENRHEDRIEAAFRLRDKIIELTKDGRARVNIVAHSHGGNVTIKAVDLYLKYLYQQGRSIARNWVRERDLTGDARARAAIERECPAWKGAVPAELVAMTRGFLEFHGAGANANAFTFLRSAAAGDSTVVGFFARVWMLSEETNRVGKIVCMGTPFYRKQWTGALSSSARYWKYIVSRIYLLPILFIPPYIIFIIYAGLVSIVPSVNFPGFNPLDWPNWMLILYILFGLAAFFLGGMESGRRNVNIYFDEGDLGSRRGTTLALAGRGADPWTLRAYARRIPLFTLSRGLLDEALLALSAEPIVYGQLAPRLREYLAPSPAVRRKKVEGSNPAAEESSRMVGFDDAAALEFYAGCFSVASGGALGLARLPFRWIYKITYPAWRFCYERWIHPRIAGFFISIMGSSGYGLPSRELRGARVMVQPELKVPSFFQETHVEMLKLEGAAGAPGRAQADDTERRYSFLKNEAELRARMAEAAKGPWRSLHEAVPALYQQFLEAHAHEPAFEERYKKGAVESAENYEMNLARLWFTLEERAKEISGAVELYHSLYYSNPAVVQQIATFLAAAPPA